MIGKNEPAVGAAGESAGVADVDKSIADTSPGGNSKAAAEQLLRLLHDGYANDVVFTIEPTGGAPKGHNVTHGMLAQWISAYSGRQNCYFSPAKHKPGATAKKFVKEDMIASHALWVDIDPRGGDQFESSRAATLEALLNYKLPPSVVVDTGNGYQAYWLLEWMQTFHDEKDAAAFESRCKRLAQSFERADMVQSRDHLMRLPDTLNVLTEKKLTTKDYPPGDRPARIVHWEPDRRYHLHEFEEAMCDAPAGGESGAKANRKLPPVKISWERAAALKDTFTISSLRERGEKGCYPFYPFGLMAATKPCRRLGSPPNKKIAQTTVNRAILLLHDPLHVVSETEVPDYRLSYLDTPMKTECSRLWYYANGGTLPPDGTLVGVGGRPGDDPAMPPRLPDAWTMPTKPRRIKPADWSL